MVEKLSKYLNVEIEISRIWGLIAETVPVGFGTLGLVKKEPGKIRRSKS